MHAVQKTVRGKMYVAVLAQLCARSRVAAGSKIEREVALIGGNHSHYLLSFFTRTGETWNIQFFSRDTGILGRRFDQLAVLCAFIGTVLRDPPWTVPSGVLSSTFRNTLIVFHKDWISQHNHTPGCTLPSRHFPSDRSEERRVGKECR